MKIKHFTDSDLDGISCGIIINHIPAVETHDIVYSNPRDINKDVENFIKAKEYLNYDKVFITDLSVEEPIALFIDALTHAVPEVDWALIDHHKSALYLNEFEWCTVSVTDDNDDKCSASYLLFLGCSDKIDSNAMEYYIDMVNRYDTFRWVVEGDVRPKYLNDLLRAYGRERFIDHVNEFIKKDSVEVLIDNPVEKMVITLEQEKIARHIDMVEQSMERMYFGKYRVGVAFCNNYISETGNTICTRNRDIHFIIMIILGAKNASMRTIRDDIDLSKIAVALGGGGHDKAAGFPLDITCSSILQPFSSIMLEKEI